MDQSNKRVETKKVGLVTRLSKSFVVRQYPQGKDFVDTSVAMWLCDYATIKRKQMERRNKMGCYVEFNVCTKKWEIKGCGGFVWEYETEAEALADYSRAVAHHWERLAAQNYVGALLASCRNGIRREA